MIRRDYILRMLEEFLEVLARIDSLKREELWQQASEAVDLEFQRLLATDASTVAQLSETELLARLIKGEPTLAVRQKTLMLTALFKEAGDVATQQDRTGEAQSFYLKGLHLLLDSLMRDEPLECPGFVPQADSLIAALQGTVLPLQTQAILMQYFERIGEFAKAEDCLFAILSSAPQSPGLAEFGDAFYGRLRTQSDDSLAAGNLPRIELEAGLAEFHAKIGAVAGSDPQQ